MLKGDLDTTGEVFDKAVSMFNTEKSVALYYKYNPEHSSWGSHIHLLSAAALATSGDIMEIGTGFFSTPVLHEIAEQQVKLFLKTQT